MYASKIMILGELKKKKLPDVPGVYFFLGNNGEILYIGKATSLSDRVRSYFGDGLSSARGPGIAVMIKKAKSVDWRTTDSVLEALILEANLIKKYQPKYNIQEKDDKSFQYAVITNEDFPRVLLVRGKEFSNKLKTTNYKPQTIFGPFPKGGALKEALKIIRKIFPFRDKCLPASGKPCFNRQIGLCPGVCSGEIGKKEYKKTIWNIRLFFGGKKKEVIKNLEKEMKASAKKKEFEKAGEAKRKIFALKHIQDISLIKGNGDEYQKENFRIEAYDVAHIGGSGTAGVMAVVSGGLPDKNKYRKFKIKRYRGANDIAGLKEILERRLAHKEWPLPDLIAVDGGKAQMNVAERVLKNNNLKIPVVAVVKNKRHRPERIIGNPRLAREHEKSLILANAEAHRFAVKYHRNIFRKQFDIK